MAKLSVNLDHIAALRQVRGTKMPDPVQAAVIAELAGAHSISAHLREDRQHIQDRDVYLLKQIVSTQLNLSVSNHSDLIHIAVDVAPHMVTLVPDMHTPGETQHGLSVAGNEKEIEKTIENLKDHNIATCIRVDPDIQQIKAARRTGVSYIELYTGYYANATGQAAFDELERLRDIKHVAEKFELNVNAGGSLDYQTAMAVADFDFIDYLCVGHALTARAALAGLESAVRDMLAII